MTMKEFMGSWVWCIRNEDGKRILDFALLCNFIIVNTCLGREKHLLSFKSGTNSNQIDYFPTEKADRIACKDCKVIPGDGL